MLSVKILEVPDSINGSDRFFIQIFFQFDITNSNNWIKIKLKT